MSMALMKFDLLKQVLAKSIKLSFPNENNSVVTCQIWQSINPRTKSIARVVALFPIASRGSLPAATAADSETPRPEFVSASPTLLNCAGALPQ